MHCLIRIRHLEAFFHHPFISNLSGTTSVLSVISLYIQYHCYHFCQSPMLIITISHGVLLWITCFFVLHYLTITPQLYQAAVRSFDCILKIFRFPTLLNKDKLLWSYPRISYLPIIPASLIHLLIVLCLTRLKFSCGKCHIILFNILCLVLTKIPGTWLVPSNRA